MTKTESFKLDQKAALESIVKHLDSLSDITKWSIIFAAIFWWSSYQKNGPIDVFGLNVSRNNAFLVGIVVYTFVNLACFFKLMRIGDLLMLISDENLLEGLSRMGTHSWDLNPFAYFGKDLAPRVYGGIGYGGLIVVWCLCNSSILSLGSGAINNYGPLLYPLLVAFGVVGLATMSAISRVRRIVLVRTAEVLPDFNSILRSTSLERNIFTVLGIIIGVGISYMTLVLASK